jgi:hypothetical protein
MYHRASGSRNTLKPSKSAFAEPALTRGGKAIKRKRPQWSAALCNVAAELAGIGQEVRHG